MSRFSVSVDIIKSLRRGSHDAVRRLFGRLDSLFVPPCQCEDIPSQIFYASAEAISVLGEFLEGQLHLKSFDGGQGIRRQGGQGLRPSGPVGCGGSVYLSEVRRVMLVSLLRREAWGVGRCFLDLP